MECVYTFQCISWAASSILNRFVCPPASYELEIMDRDLYIKNPAEQQSQVWQCLKIDVLSSFYRTGESRTLNIYRGKSPNIGRCPNTGRCIISYQEVLSSLLKNVNHQADEAVLCNHSIIGQLLRTSVLTGRLCFAAL